MSEADKMFEELGYKKYEYANMLDYICTQKTMGETFHFKISFLKTSKLIKFEQLIGMQELKAINKKCEELGWI